MSRATKWKIEKAKVKVVFRLQFHATQIPQSGWEKLFISFIPTDTGKATAKTSKANVRNGTCKWADPIYETTRLLVDSKSKQYDDKLYKLVVGMGTSRSSILGEATLNLSDYADASQPSAIALPLHGSDHGTVLHVTVQLLTAKTGFREFEQQRDKGLQRESGTSTPKSSSSDLQIPEDLVNKAKTRLQLREETNIHEEYSDSQVTCDESSNTSESYFVDKNDSPGNHEKLNGSDQTKLGDDVTSIYEENHRLRESLEVAESSISELKLELTVLQSHANEMGTETQKFAQELATEIASGQELAKEVTVLKSECSKFKHDLELLKEKKSNSKVIEIEITEHDKELKWVNGVSFVEDKIKGIQEKILIGFRESDLSFLNSDLESLLGTVQDLKRDTVEPGSMLHVGEIPSLPLQESDTGKAEREILVKKMNQMESYYEALVQELEENQKRILGEFETLKNEMNDLSSVNNELQKRSTISESALKRARLNYSIAVSQLQKDLDMLSFQVLSMFETNQTVIKESFPDNSPPVSKHISNDLKKSLSLQENIYKKVEEELSEMCSANLCLEVYSGTLKETLVEASDHLRKMNKKLQELAHNLQLSNQSRDVLFEDVRALNGENTYYLAKCNDLHVQNQRLEKDLGNVSNENFLLMEKITECEALLMDYKVYKSKHEVVSGEKMNLEKELETLKSENDVVKRKFKNSLHDMVAKLEIPNVSLEKLQMKLDSVANKFRSSLESEENQLENNEAVLTYLSSLELELQKISSEDKNFHEQIMGMDRMIEEFEKSKLMVSELNQEKQDLILNVESKRDEFSNVVSELDRLKESFRFVNDELDIERSTVACLTAELENRRSELDHVRKHASDRELENNKIQEFMICEDLKLTVVKTQYETQIDELVKQLHVSIEQCRELEKMHLENEARYIKEFESLQIKVDDSEVRLDDCMLNEARYIEEIKKLTTELESVRLELDASITRNAEILVSKNDRDLEVGQLKDMLTKSKAEIDQCNELQMKFQDIESKLKLCLENEARYIEENKKLSTELESVRSELDASIAQHTEISVLKSERDVEVGQLKDMLTKSNEEIGQYNELQMKYQDSESRLKLCLENEARYVEEINTLTMELESLQMKINDAEARLNDFMSSETRYIEENKKLSTELESVKLDLEASISQHAEISVSKNERDLEVGQMKEMLTKSKMEIEQYNELQMKFEDSESRLIYSLENEARYIEDNKKLSTELESVKLELETSHAQNAEISVSKNEFAFKVGQLKDMLTKSKAEIEQYSELETKFQDIESRLKLHLENEARYIEDNRNLATELKSLQMKLSDTEARLNDCMSNEARFIEDNEKLSTELKSVKLELEAFIAQNDEISVLKNERDFEVGQLKEMLAQSKADLEQFSGIQTKLQDTESRLKLSLENEAVYIEENRNLAAEIESLKLELEASHAQNAEISVLKNKLDVEVGQLKDMLTKSKSEIEQYNEFQVKFQDTESRLKLCLENEGRYIEENRNLAMELESVRLEFKAFIAHNEDISESKETNKDGSSISEEESEIVLVVLKAKLDEQNDELIKLQNKCSELTNKLSEQILKTEEFKNMSTYLKELKDKADVAREKKESEGPSESLRVVFIKEQYQAKMNELKQQLSVSKKHNEEMLFKLQDAVDEIESRKKSEASQLKRIQELETEVESVNSDKPDFDRIKAELECAILSLECCKEEKEKLVALLQECEDEKSKIAVELSLINEKLTKKEENGHMGDNGSVDSKDEQSITSIDVRFSQGVSTEREFEDENNSLLNDSKQLMVVNDQFRTQHLRTCMEQLDEELEKMKNDNSLLPLTNYDPSFQDLQRELVQLNEANEELGSIYPSFVDFPGNGNALERVLALEIELAEALRSKKKSSIQFQSSFLKQHSDEEAIFKSFRDINELIKDMLDIKGKYVNVENELKEMHDRYSQLSLQFAEVEGERQKLMMTLKNVRSSRNLLRSNRSPMTSLEDQTS